MFDLKAEGGGRLKFGAQKKGRENRNSMARSM